MKNIRLLAIINFWAFLIHLAFVYFTQTKMINDVDVSEISARHHTLFTPAPITFAIWGLIYFLLLILCIYHIFTAFKYPDTHLANEHTHRMGGLFILCNLTTAAWLYCWTHAWLGFSLGLIAFQLILLIAMNVRLHIYDRDAGAASKIFTQLPLSIWFAWITIATIASAAVYLDAIGWSGMGLTSVQWTQIMIGVAAFIGMCVVLGRRNIFFGLVVLWALCGIILERTKDGTPDYPEIVLVAEVSLVLMAIGCLIQLARNLSFRRHHLRRHYPLFPEAPHPLK
ncbi:MAG TPA: hypothetical protein VHD83_08655 [Puia sp.]|nr:hypothetical protein [Puia sp.]